MRRRDKEPAAYPARPHDPNCPVLGCTRRRKRGMELCKHCWAKVPTSIRARVMRLFHDRLTRNGPEHLAAIDDAIVSVPPEPVLLEA